MNTIVNQEQWVAQRKQLLVREKELMRQQDQLASDRRALPWVRVDKQYVFDTPQGKRSLSDLFEGRSQLVLQHFMFAPGQERGCAHCSYMADHTDGALSHLAQRDVSLVVVSRAPLASLERMRKEMGWQFRWVSSGESDFNYDFHVSFAPEEMAGGEVYYNYTGQGFPHEDAPGVSVFYKDEAGVVYHTYSTFGRGVEVMMHTYRFLDITPLGRHEEGLPYTMAWVRHHDRYAQPAASCCSSSHA
ncbi:DUF899 domain-containing protein [Massilia eburnea]|uniref:DUF899 domain-containing protein n=1 Tax=Massilia eburnea TaxID=1776165 RepID=UPI003D6B052E